MEEKRSSGPDGGPVLIATAIIMIPGAGAVNKAPHKANKATPSSTDTAAVQLIFDFTLSQAGNRHSGRQAGPRMKSWFAAPSIESRTGSSFKTHVRS